MSRISRVKLERLACPMDPMLEKADYYSYIETEDTIGWKAAFYKNDKGQNTPVLIKLKIPAGARRLRYNDPLKEKYAKHRCECASVLGYYSYYTGKEIKNLYTVRSLCASDSLYYFDGHGHHLKFPDRYDQSYNVCSNGLHYFNTKESALMYMDNYIAWSFDYRVFKPRKNTYYKFSLSLFENQYKSIYELGG